MTDKTTPERQPVADALPPLPASQAFSLTRSVYTADQMRAYASAALASRDAEIARVHAAYCHSQQQFLDAQAELAKLRQGEPAAEIKWAADIVGSIMEVRLYDYELPVGTKLYASPPPAQPTQAEPLSDEDIAQLWSPHPGGEVRRPILGWGKVCDFARAIERLITERMSAGGTK